VFALLALVTELTGRSLTGRLDRAFHVRPLAAPAASYYPFLLAGIRLLAAFAVAAIAWRILRAHSTASAGERVLRAFGQRRVRRPEFRLVLTFRLWFASFGATSLWFLVQDDVDRVSQGHWPVLAPWLHTYALPVFAVLSVLFALAWGAVRTWLHEVERFASHTWERVCRVLSGAGPAFVCAVRVSDLPPRHRFGVVFESRPPPLST
jgi:hypothetical protein